MTRWERARWCGAPKQAARIGVTLLAMLVAPEVMGICVWSPRLDDLGNSARGIEFCKQLVSRYNFHIYDRLTRELNHKRDPRLKKNQSRIEGVVNHESVIGMLETAMGEKSSG
jgi:hypothetical protein